jgi:hypothetical protein
MTAAQLEQFVFGKTYFSAAGLTVAVDGARPIGFSHAGFAPNTAGNEMDETTGVISRIMCVPHAERGVILVELLAAAEHYLLEQGAKKAYAYTADGLGPFYLGFYGSAQLPGVLRSDDETLNLLQGVGYAEIGGSIIWQRSLVDVSLPMDFTQQRLRRVYTTEIIEDPIAGSWWEAINTSCWESLGYRLVNKNNGNVVAEARVWLMHPISCAWGLPVVGLHFFQATKAAWQEGCPITLLSDIIKDLSARRVAIMELVTNIDSPMNTIMQCLGFGEAERGVHLSKQLS